MTLTVETTPTIEVAPVQFSSDRTVRNAQIRALASAAPETREVALRASAEAAAAYYASDTGAAELSDWRALDGEDFRE